MALGAAAGWEAQRRFALPRTSVERARLLLDFGRSAEARAIIDARLARDPDDNETWLLEGRRRGAENDYSGAAEAFGKVAEESLFYPESRLRRGQVAMLRHDAKTAEEAFRATLYRGQPGDAGWLEAGEQLLNLQNLQDRTVEAAELSDLLLRHMSPGDRARLQDELTIRSTGRIDVRERIAGLRKFVAANPTDQVSLGALALALCEDGRPDEALLAVKPAFASGADLPYLVWRGRLRALFDSQQFEELRAALPLAPAAAREQSWYWSFLATAQQQANDGAGALASIQKALTFDDQELPINRLAATIFRRNGRPELADAAEQRATVRGQREKELRDAWAWWTGCNAGRKPYATTAAAGQRLATACAALGQTGRAAYYREMAAAFADLARRNGDAAK